MLSGRESSDVVICVPLNLKLNLKKKKEKQKWYEHQDYNSGYVIISDPAKEEKKIVY